MNDALLKKNTAAKVSLSEKKLDKYFPPHYSAKERENPSVREVERTAETGTVPLLFIINRIL